MLKLLNFLNTAQGLTIKRTSGGAFSDLLYLAKVAKNLFVYPVLKSLKGFVDKDL